MTTLSALIVPAATQWSWDRYGPILLESIGQTLTMVLLTMVFGGIGGLLLGLALYVTRTGGVLPNRAVNVVLNLLVNVFRPIPFIVLILALSPVTAAVVGTAIGTTAAVVPLSIAVTFGFSRIVEQNLVTISPGVIEAARAAGAGPWRIIATLLVPEALGPLILGYTFVVVAIVDMTAVAGAVGAGGLGSFALTYGFRRWDFLTMWIAIGIIIVLVQLAQFLGNRLARRILRR
ncbi:ABC transporter permease subunit [Microbacterium sp. 5K110]|jgi:D-methionine transport system permease protein|uniref:methionine ABC transporter permease n=1 Tax=unclassified Microbacterium TaxID=2609290 RepID=UPI0010FE5D6A|nr:ABC transporter permease subunit [Microbacterium sp. 5K110]TLF31128.1 ABC transporter permease subunit [Microbacterium sp. 5K110]